MEDLVRAFDLQCTVDFWRLTSNGTDIKSSQSVHELISSSAGLCDQHMILVDDTVDSGRTLARGLRRLGQR